MDFKMDFRLVSMLEQIKTSGEEEEFIKKYADRSGELQFHEYLRQHIVENGISMAEVMTNSRLNTNAARCCLARFRARRRFALSSMGTSLR